MKKTYFFLAAPLALLMACNNTPASTTTDSDTTATAVTSAETATATDFSFKKTLTAGTVGFDVSSPNATPGNTVSILPSGFEVNDKITDSIEGDVKDAFTADLNGDGFPEVYYSVFTPSKEMKLYGYGSNKNKSLSQIYMPDINEDEKMGLGHMNGDGYEIKDNKLVRTFPIYKKEDPASTPTGGTRTVTYKLEAGENGWALKAVDFKDAQ